MSRNHALAGLIILFWRLRVPHVRLPAEPARWLRADRSLPTTADGRDRRRPPAAGRSRVPAREIPIGTAPKGPVAPAFPPAIPSIDYGGRLRVGVRFQNPANPTSLGDVSQTVLADLYASGQIHRMWRWLIAITTDTYGGSAGQPSTVSLRCSTRWSDSSPCPRSRSGLAACWSWPTGIPRVAPGGWTSGSIPGSIRGLPRRRSPSPDRWGATSASSCGGRRWQGT